MTKWWQIGHLIFLLLFLTFLIANPINLTNTDLGRHLKNGEIILSTFKVPETNLYSYTYPDYTFVNHHWGSGVIFYLIKQLFGFTGLSVFFIVLSLATFLLIFDLARKFSNFYLATVVGLILIPLISIRTEIRPEIFSYFFSALFFWILWNFKEGKISGKWLLTLPLLELLWVNLHIYFFFGLGLLGVFTLDFGLGYVLKRDQTTRKNLKNLFLVTIASSLVTLINPLGLKGALYPLNIFDNYGYRLFENQTFLYIEKLFSYPPALFFKIGFGLLVISLIYYFYQIYQKKQTLSLSLVLLNLGFAYLGLSAVRNFTHFGFFALALICLNIGNLNNWGKKLNNPSFNFVSFPLILITILVSFYIINPDFFSQKKVRLGLTADNLKALDFFKEQGIKGPIFDNYDIGGYLIYGLYPEKVFVDNRPETYPASFFNEIYIPMQEKEEVWKKIDAQYKFNVIFFNRLDLTPWGQQFLIARIKDRDWIPVFVDENIIIFVKNNDQNQEIIKKYKLPQEMFKTSG